MASADIERRETAWWRAGLGLILLTLAALVLVPGLVQWRVNALRAEIEAAQPARTLVMQLQFNLVREMASLSELLLNGDTTYRARYRIARAREDQIFETLRPLAGELGPRLEASLDEALRQTTRWHARVADTAIVARGAALADSADAIRNPALFEEALAAVADVDTGIVQLSQRNRDEIRQIEMMGMAVTVGLGFLAFLAALAAAYLHRRLIRLAGESDRQRLEAERALAETARATEARTRLLRGVTHDVKNPLGAAKGYAELLGMGVKGPLEAPQQEYLQKIQRSLDSALAIIADLLDVARADSGALQVRPKPTVIAAVARDAADAHHASAEAMQHLLMTEDTCGDLQLLTDPARVQQVLGNLLSNAIKYTPPPGRIVVRTSLVEGRRGPGDGPWATIEVIDNGPGIPVDLRESIFDEFTRVDEGSTLKGHGLGLAIARRVARLLGGDLTVSDAPGGGALFTLWLPVGAVPAADAAEAEGVEAGSR